MAKLAFEMKGLDKLTKALIDKAKMEVIKELIKQHTADLQTAAQRRTSTEYTGHFEGKKFVLPTGATKRSIQLSLQNKGLEGHVGMGMDYDPYLEKGTRFMRARPVLRPTFETEAEKLHSDLQKVVK